MEILAVCLVLAPPLRLGSVSSAAPDSGAATASSVDGGGTLFICGVFMVKPDLGAALLILDVGPCKAMDMSSGRLTLSARAPADLSKLGMGISG